MHKEELKDVVKELFGYFTEGEYIRYFTSKFPRLLVHCYNAVEKEARDLLAEYFHEDASAQAPAVAIRTLGITMKGSKLTINCEDDITFSEKKIEINSLDIWNISHLFVKQNKSFTNFLQKNGLNITQLEFYNGSLKFDSMNKILQKLPNLREIKFDEVKYEASNQTIQQTTCHNLVKLQVLGLKRQKLLQAFPEWQTMQKLRVLNSEVTLEEILQKYAILEEIKVEVNDNFPVSDEHEANAKIDQLKGLKIELRTEDEKIQNRVIRTILKHNNLQQFHFDSDNIYSPSQLLCEQLAVHICQLKSLTILEIYDERLLEEVEELVANCLVVWITRMEEFGCQLRHFKSLPSSFLGHFTNLRKLDIHFWSAEETKVENLISFMNKSQLTSITLTWLHSASFQLFQHLQVYSLQMLVIHIDNMYEVKVPALDILQEFLPKHSNITQFKIGFYKDYDEPKSLKLISMILATLPQLERLKVWNCPKITADVIKQIALLETLESWKINQHESETFYKTYNWAGNY